MKSTRRFTLTLSFVAVCVSQSVVAQSSFIFSNYLPRSGVDAPIFDFHGDRISGNHFVAVLYGGPTPSQLTLAWDEVLLHNMAPVPIDAIWDGAGGYFDGGFVQIGTVPCGGLSWLQVRAWDARLGSSYEQVAALGMGGYGESPLFQAYGGANCGLPSPPMPMIGLQSFSLVPEPRTVLLLLVGLPALLLVWWQRVSRKT